MLGTSEIETQKVKIKIKFDIAISVLDKEHLS